MCNFCQVENSPESNFCQNCGMRISSTVARSSDTTSSQVEEPAGGNTGGQWKLLVSLGAVLIFVVGAASISNMSKSEPQQIETSSSSPLATLPAESTTLETLETLGEANARQKAEDYLAFSAFSKSGLIDQLIFEGFTRDEAVYGVNHISVDWNEQAAKKAAQYMSFQSFSANGLIQQLIFEGFTKRQAAYGAVMVGFRP